MSLCALVTSGKFQSHIHFEPHFEMSATGGCPPQNKQEPLSTGWTESQVSWGMSKRTTQRGQVNTGQWTDASRVCEIGSSLKPEYQVKKGAPLSTLSSRSSRKGCFCFTSILPWKVVAGDEQQGRSKQAQWSHMSLKKNLVRLLRCSSSTVVWRYARLNVQVHDSCTAHIMSVPYSKLFAVQRHGGSLHLTHEYWHMVWKFTK